PWIEMSDTIRLTMINETIVEPSASKPASATDGCRINTRSARKFTIRKTIQKTTVASTIPAVVVETPLKISAERTIPTTMPISDEAMRIPQRASMGGHYRPDGRES